MNISLIVLFTILIVHFIADFIVQTHWQASNKSKDNRALTKHIITYSLCWLWVCNTYSVVTGNYLMVALFPIITFICHWITDYFTSRSNSKLYKEGKIHTFFVSVGFDQLLHYTQLILTYQLLK